jgi:hypothetical protein
MLIEKTQNSSNFAPKKGEHILAHQNWVKADNVKVSFSIMHNGTSILLFYRVEEPQVRAVNTAFNSSVWEDSCVEFFLSLDGDDSYYNFEINAIGTVLGAYGPDRNKRNWLPESLLSKVETVPSLGRKVIENLDETTVWNLRVKIPVVVLAFSDITDLSGMDGHGNFYKCGDKLKHPHFLSWKPVILPTPDFHQPRFFGQLSFL